MRMTSIFVLAASMAVVPAAAEEEHRELGPHEHGHGTLNIAIEKARVSMELKVPGMDIVGFEHSAESADQKAAVERATKLLGEPLKLFKVPASAGCKVAAAKVAIETEYDDGDKDHAVETKEQGGEHATNVQKGHEDEKNGGHNEFHVSYLLDCAKPTDLTSIEFDYFKSFAGANELDVNVVTAKAQNKYEVTRDEPSLDLGGMM